MSEKLKAALDAVLSILPDDIKQKLQSCKSKEDFLALIKPLQGMIPTDLLGGLGEGNPLGGLMSGLGISSKSEGDTSPIDRLGDLMKGAQWPDVQKYISAFTQK